VDIYCNSWVYATCRRSGDEQIYSGGADEKLAALRFLCRNFFRFQFGFCAFWAQMVWACSFFNFISFGNYLFPVTGFSFPLASSSSTSRVYILFGVSSTIATTILAALVLGDVFSGKEITGIFLLLLGGAVISFKFYAGRFFSHWRGATLAGLLAAFSMILLKLGFDNGSFVNGYVVSRMGILFAALCALAIPDFRKSVFENLKKRKRRENVENLAGTIVAKTTAGAGTFLINWSISLGSVAIVSSFVSVQYLLTFVFALFLSFFLKDIFIERFSVLNFLTKMAGILLVTLGTMLVIF